MHHPKSPRETPPLTRGTASEARRVLSQVRPEVRPDGSVLARYEVHGMSIVELTSPAHWWPPEVARS